METVTSADGTTIAYERSGEGPPVVIVGGGLGKQTTYAALAEALLCNSPLSTGSRRMATPPPASCWTGPSASPRSALERSSTRRSTSSQQNTCAAGRLS